MVTVALVGADGAGKTTVGRALADTLDRPVRYVYLGANPAAATHALPTTRAVHRVRRTLGRAPQGGPPALDRRAPAAPATIVGRATRTLRAAIRSGNQVAEAGYRWTVIRWHRRRGRVVVVDRWLTADHHAHDLAAGARLGLGRRIHARFIRRAFPVPEVLVVLDAPADVLHARKGEGSLAELAQRRQEYLDYLDRAGRGVLVDATRPLDEVLATVTDTVGRALGGRP